MILTNMYLHNYLKLIHLKYIVIFHLNNINNCKLDTACTFVFIIHEIAYKL